ncbi:endonuclease/exonuclease/phosphatase family protein [Streptomyces sp. NPDC060366]|uniref:endonuclease/exonuclease/phosphatase family protein n=1 Tax=Streptomyces sp. NPDC060366 TaxID=3347105 RepID=UPI00366A0032
MQRSNVSTARLAAKAWLIAILALLGSIVPAQAEPAVEASATVIPNRFMTWNTNGQDLGSTEMLVEQVRRFRPQVVAFQESCLNEVQEAVEELKELGLEYGYRVGLHAWLPGFGCNAQRVGTAVIYAKGTLVKGHNRKGYSVDEGWREARGIQSFHTKIDGQWVRVFNTHLSSPWPEYEEMREQQVDELVAATRPHSRALVLGDLNTRPWRTQVTGPIWQAGFRDVDQFCGETKSDRCNRTVGTKGDAKFDYILHRRVNSLHCRIHTVNTDHRLVISDVTLAQGPQRPCTVT